MACICENCKYLKSEAGGEEGEILLSCDFGFPSEKCETCEEDMISSCEEKCEHYENLEPISMIEIPCDKCGKMLSVTTNEENGKVFCVTCYLKDTE